MSQTSYDRRTFMGYFASIGLGSTLLPGVLWSQQQAQGATVTKEMVAAAAQISGMQFTDDEETAIARGIAGTQRSIASVRALAMPNSVFPATVFDPVPAGETMPVIKKGETVRSTVPVMARPGSLDELAFEPVTHLAAMIKSRKVKPSELTDMYLSRLKRFDSQLHFVINLTEDRARQQAKDLDAEIAAGKYRGPLHGIPWGAKDLLSVKGYPTTWGAGLYKDQSFDTDAPLVTRLDNAGAILVAKLTLGALAQGDVWYGERTRNPWDPTRGSSGSSAGPASATAAGCVGFGIGTETNGSITAPSSECGVTGHRPTFGRVPRTGAMALSWTMDKLGPICRSAEDCATVFSVIQGPDGWDRAVKDVPFTWNAARKLSTMRIGFVPASFAPGPNDGPGQVASKKNANDMLDILKAHGAKLIEVTLPQTPLSNAIASIVLDAECGAAFQPDTLTDKIKELETPADFIPNNNGRGYSTWAGTFRAAQFISAPDYINALRARQQILKPWWDLFKDYDVIITLNENTSTTNTTGTPSIAVPTGLMPQVARGAGGRGGRGGAAPPVPDTTPVAPLLPIPSNVRILGPLYHDENILNVAHVYQQNSEFHKQKPPLFV